MVWYRGKSDVSASALKRPMLRELLPSAVQGSADPTRRRPILARRRDCGERSDQPLWGRTDEIAHASSHTRPIKAMVSASNECEGSCICALHSLKPWWLDARILFADRCLPNDNRVTLQRTIQRVYGGSSLSVRRGPLANPRTSFHSGRQCLGRVSNTSDRQPQARADVYSTLAPPGSQWGPVNDREPTSVLCV
jgi:hypothetical protein